MIREESIEILKSSIISEERGKDGKPNGNITCDLTREVLEMAIKALEQTRWIPVSEKLPEDGIYLVTVERTSGEPRIETKSFAKDLHRVDSFDFPKHKCGWYDYDSEYGYWEDTDVIAWMPLPQPYEPQESEVKE